MPWQVDVLQGKGLEALALTGHPGSKDAGKEWIAPNPDISVSHCHTQHKALAVPQWLCRAALCVCPPETSKPSCPSRSQHQLSGLEGTLMVILFYPLP